jgi:hypothetical protein
MGGDKQQKKTNQLIQNQQAQIGQEHAQATSQNQSDVNRSQGQANAQYGGLNEGYKSLMNPAAADPRLEQSGGVYKDFATTGGISDADRANIRARGTSTIPAFFDVAKNEANRARAVQGGYGPGTSGLMARFGRSQAAAGADAALNTELGISDRVSQGRQWGATGLENQARGDQTLNMQRTSLGLAGRQGLYDTANSNAEAAKSRGLQERGLTYDAQGNVINSSMQNKANPWWKSVIGGAVGAFT